MYFEIDNDVLRFLNGHFGNNDADAFVRCSNLAYRDMCRTITYAPAYNENSALGSKEKNAIADKKKELRNAVTVLIKEQVEEWVKKPPANQDEFDKKHAELCQKIIKKYEGTTKQKGTDSLYFGQAQKWVNMALKNLYVYSKSNITTLSFASLLPYMHIPIDNIILDIASGKKKCYVDTPDTSYNVTKPSNPWSQWSDDEYAEYQTKLKTTIGSTTAPILWELTHWSTVKE